MTASCSQHPGVPILFLLVQPFHHLRVLMTSCASEMCFSALSCDLNTMATLPSLSKMKVCAPGSR